MKLDRDLMLLLLLELEGEEAVDLSGYADEQIGHHRNHLLTKGLARGADMTGLGDRYSTATIWELTPTGHDYLAAHREKAKTQESTPVEETQNLVELRKKISESFSKGEFKALCFDLGVPYQELPGETMSEKALELIAFMRRRGRLAELKTHCQRARPHVSW